MTFITGSITNANPGPALYAAIETAALADGWTLDDTRVIGSNTHKVLKSAAAGNVQGLDWFLDINYPTTGVTGGIRFAAFEGYNSGTGVAVNGPYAISSTIIDPTTYSRYGSTGHALETNWFNTASHAGLSNTLSTSAFTYWISITRDRIIVMLSTQVSNIHYAGFYTPTAAHASHAGGALFPLITTRLTTTTSTTAGSSSSSVPSASLTRLPKITSVSWNASCSTWGGPHLVGILGAGVIGAGGLSPSVITGETSVTPIPILAGTTSFNVVGTTPAAFIGTLMDMGGASVVDTSMRGDEVTIGSDTWYVCTHASQFTLLFKAA
jgi:hypothetical protein